MLHQHGVVYVWIQISHVDLEVALLALSRLRLLSIVGRRGALTTNYWARVKSAALTLGEARG